jgi:hypothetical protein
VRQAGNGDLRNLVLKGCAKRGLRMTRKAHGYGVCATSQGGAAQGGAPLFAPLRHLRHPLIGVAKWSGAKPPPTGLIRRKRSDRPTRVAKPVGGNPHPSHWVDALKRVRSPEVWDERAVVKCRAADYHQHSQGKLGAVEALNAFRHHPDAELAQRHRSRRIWREGVK